MSQLRELIKPSVEDSDFFPVPPETSTVMVSTQKVESLSCEREET